MEYTAYGAQQPAVRVSYRGDRACVRMTGEYAPPVDEESSGSWPEAYGEFDAVETPAEADILADFDAWWGRCAAWESEEAVPDPALELIAVRRELSELREVVDIMLTGGGAT